MENITLFCQKTFCSLPWFAITKWFFKCTARTTQVRHAICLYLGGLDTESSFPARLEDKVHQWARVKTNAVSNTEKEWMQCLLLFIWTVIAYTTWAKPTWPKAFPVLIFLPHSSLQSSLLSFFSSSEITCQRQSKLLFSFFCVLLPPSILTPITFCLFAHLCVRPCVHLYGVRNTILCLCTIFEVSYTYILCWQVFCKHTDSSNRFQTVMTKHIKAAALGHILLTKSSTLCLFPFVREIPCYKNGRYYYSGQELTTP